MFIEQPAIFLRWLYPRAVWRMDKKVKAVYLTFDDGPIPEATPFILDTLRSYGVKATFFMVGHNARKYPSLFYKVRKEGHAIGNHSFNHFTPTRHWSYNYLKNVEKADKVFKSRLFRPPHGWMRLAHYVFLRRHYRIIMWDVITRDYSRLQTARDVVNNVKRYTRNGSIITFHDSLKSIDKLKTALPEVLEWLIEQGYEFKTL